MAGNMEHTQRVIVKDYVGQWCTQCTAQTWHLEKVFINLIFFFHYIWNCYLLLGVTLSTAKRLQVVSKLSNNSGKIKAHMHANLVPARTHARRSSILFGIRQEYLGCQGRQTKQISNLVCDKRFWWICSCFYAQKRHELGPNVIVQTVVKPIFIFTTLNFTFNAKGFFIFMLWIQMSE